MKIVISESQYSTLINEHYDSDKLYSRASVVNRLKKAPRELRKFANDLPSIPCTDGQGNETICTKIPEVVYIYFTGKY
jgi:hypothetical protein